MNDDNVLYWSCNREKHIRISSKQTYVERLGYKLDTEWFLEVTTKFDYITHCNCPVEETFTCKLMPIWEFYLRRTSKSETANITVNFFSSGFDMYLSNFFLNLEEDTIFIGVLNSKMLPVPYFDLTFVLRTDGQVKSSIKEKSVSKLDNLSEDFQSMFGKGDRFDVTLKCDKEVIRAHKNVLGARSPVFGTMFKSDMEEAEKNEVRIEDMDPKVLRTLVYFMYSGQVEALDLRFARDLLYASEKYQVEALKEGCIEYLQSILANENAFEILEIGDLYDESLLSNSMQYICKHFSELKLKEEWQRFRTRKPLIAMKIYSLLKPYFDINL